jgi:DNA-binding response OmpR family regulator
MGFRLEEKTICELAARIASHVVQAIGEAQKDGRIVAKLTNLDVCEVMHVGPLEINMGRREAMARGCVMPLKPQELMLLAALAKNVGRALSREQMLELAWGDAAVERVQSERTVDVHVRRLRRHLGPDAHLLRTVARVGYRLDSA